MQLVQNKKVKLAENKIIILGLNNCKNFNFVSTLSYHCQKKSLCSSSVANRLAKLSCKIIRSECA